MQNSQQDTDLLKLLYEEDPSALGQLFMKYYEQLYTYAVNMSGDQQLARDAIQDLFVLLWQRRDKALQIHSLKGYLWTVLRRDLLKRMENGRSLDSLTAEEEQELFCYALNVEETCINDEWSSQRNNQLLEAYRRLPARYREAIHLKYYENMSYAELEQILGVSHQVALNYIHNGLKKMRALLSTPASQENKKIDY